MSAVLGVFRFDGSTTGDPVAGRMLARMRRRGADRADVWREAGTILGATRYDWELESGFSGPVLVVQDRDLVIAADASLYYRDDLRRKLALAGVRPSGQTASHLILAAYRAWGERCPAELEGDFAFVLFDRVERTVLCARDFAGKRPLFYTALPNGGLAVASTIGALLAHPECSAAFDPLRIGLDAAGMLFAPGHDTAYKHIDTLPAGSSLARQSSGHHRLTRHWNPPTFQNEGNVSFAEGAEHLCDLLTRATGQRLASEGDSAAWMSGGFDSSAVFATGQRFLSSSGDRRKLHIVSVSYPVGDPGREDELIASVAERWDTTVRWLNVQDIGLLDDVATRAAERDDSFGHIYERWNRALAKGARSVGARVALDGNGGDQLFQVSTVYLADLLISGKWFALASAWREEAVHDRTVRAFLKQVVQPALPRSVRALTALLRGRDVAANLESRIPKWIRQDFVRAHDLQPASARSAYGSKSGTLAQRESDFYFSTPFFPRVFASLGGFALEAGVELRSPLLDRRVAEFAAARPRWERRSAGETKHLLRRSVRGLLPDDFLAKRASHTGVMTGYLRRSLLAGLADVLVSTLDTRCVLDEMGIIDVSKFRRSCGMFFRNGDASLGAMLLFTIQTELWLRARIDPDSAPLPLSSCSDFSMARIAS